MNSTLIGRLTKDPELQVAGDIAYVLVLAVNPHSATTRPTLSDVAREKQLRI